MDITFKFEIELSLGTNETRVVEIKQSEDVRAKIKAFIQEFFKHPTAVLAYYRSLFMDEFIDHMSYQWEQVATFLNYLPDYDILFMEIAKNCSPEVIEFFETMLSEETDDRDQNIQKKIHRQILEEELHSFSVINARFLKIHTKESQPVQ